MSSAIQKQLVQHGQARVRHKQPLAAAEVADALLRLQTVQALTGLGKTKVFELIKSGELDAVRLGNRCTRIRSGTLQAWLQAQGK